MVTSRSSAGLLSGYLLLLFFFLRSSSEVQQEQRMEEPVPAEAVRACGRPAVDQLRLSFSHGCITVEPAVGVAAAPAC